MKELNTRSVGYLFNVLAQMLGKIPLLVAEQWKPKPPIMTSFESHKPNAGDTPICEGCRGSEQHEGLELKACCLL